MEETLKIEGKIYLIRCLVNNKIYIGQTKKSIIARFNAHSVGHDPTMPICGAIKKHGKENFTTEAIDFTDNQDDLNKKEIHWISKYDSRNKKKGYNNSPGGTGYIPKKGSRKATNKGMKHTDEAKAKISKASKESASNPENKALRSKIAKEKWNDLEYREKTLRSMKEGRSSEECKDKHKKSMEIAQSKDSYKEMISKQFKALWDSPEYKEKMTQKRKEIGADPEFIEKMTEINKKGARSRALRKFSVHKAVLIKIENNTKTWNKGEFVGFWECKFKCAEDLHINKHHINSCICGETKQGGGYIFEYTEELNAKL